MSLHTHEVSGQDFTLISFLSFQNELATFQHWFPESTVQICFSKLRQKFLYFTNIELPNPETPSSNVTSR